MNNNIRLQFPLLNSNIVYLDSAATSQKPQVVLDDINNYYLQSNANVHRGMYDLAHKSDMAWTQAHIDVARYINASKEEVFFVNNATEGLNWFAHTAAEQLLNPGDVIAISRMEHHSNILPWKRLQKILGITIEYLDFNENLCVDPKSLEKLFEVYGKRLKIVSVVHMSNVIGSINDIPKIAQLCHSYDAKLIVDATQSIVHQKIDVKELECDVLVFSGHKVYGPMGIGVVFVEHNLISNLNPIFLGGEMVDSVKDNDIVFKELPYRFEAGTPNIGGAVGLASALKWLDNQERDSEKKLCEYMYSSIKSIKNINIISTPNSPILSFTHKNIHVHDLASDLGEFNICVRAGYHCAQPLHEYLGISPTLRLSLGIYNYREDIDRFVEVFTQIVKKYE